MPLINIHLNEGRSADFVSQLGDCIHEVLMETWSIPQDDRFHIIHEHKKGHFQIDKQMWDVQRTDDVILLQIISSPRTKEMKLAFYQRLPQVLSDRLGVRTEDVMINVVTTGLEDWSFGNGQAQLL